MWEDLGELEIHYEIEELGIMKREAFKKIVHIFAFSDLINRKEGRCSDNAKGKKIKYDEYILAEYLTSHEEDLSIEDKKVFV